MSPELALAVRTEALTFFPWAGRNRRRRRVCAKNVFREACGQRRMLADEFAWRDRQSLRRLRGSLHFARLRREWRPRGKGRDLRRGLRGLLVDLYFLRGGGWRWPGFFFWGG